jgi:protease-4
VATARKSTPQAIDAVAQGRVWSGVHAKEHGLVDRLGSLRDAVKSAAQRAKLPEDVRVVYVEKKAGRLQRVMDSFGAWAGLDTAGAAVEAPALGPLSLEAALARAALDPELAELARLILNTRAGSVPQALAHCGCALWR